MAMSPCFVPSGIFFLFSLSRKGYTYILAYFVYKGKTLGFLSGRGSRHVITFLTGNNKVMEELLYLLKYIFFFKRPQGYAGF